MAPAPCFTQAGILPHPFPDGYADFMSALITKPHIHIVLSPGVGYSHLAVRALVDHDFPAGHDQRGKVPRVGDHLGGPPIPHQQPERLELGVAHADGRLEFVQAGKRRLQPVVETTGPGGPLDVLGILAGRAVLHPVLEVQSLLVQHLIAVIHRGTVIVEMCRHGLLPCWGLAMLGFREPDTPRFLCQWRR